MQKQYKVGVIGATGMVGQRFITLLANHPWFNLTTVAASPRSKGKRYADAVSGRWLMTAPLPDNAKDLIVLDATADIDKVAANVDFVFSAVDMSKDEIFALEEAYAKAEVPVVSNNSVHRQTPDVPMIIPELNHAHIDVIPAQRKRLGTKRGFIAVKSNCSIQAYVPALFPVDKQFPVDSILVCTYQAISGSGKNFEMWPEMVDNIIPYIGGGEEEKSEREPLKIWGSVQNGVIVPSALPKVTAQCIRVPVTDGHMAATFVRFAEGKTPTKQQIIDIWNNYESPIAKYNLPSAPKKFLNYFTEQDRPQTKLDRDIEGGMAVSIGRLREDSQYDFKFVCLSHNTLLGAAGGSVEVAELLCATDYIS
jgi:aspartate-semialdehyde dehydrogenase